MKTKKLLCGILSFLCLFTAPLQTFAFQKTNIQATATETALFQNTSAYDESNMLEAITLDNMELGDRKILGTENGEIFYVEVTAINEGLARSSNESVSKEFSFNKTTILGTTKTMFKVKLVCNWTSNGSSSKLKKLSGSYTTYDSSVSCSWNGNYTAISDTYATLGLDTTYGSSTAFIIFSASLSLDKTYVTLNCSC